MQIETVFDWLNCQTFKRRNKFCFVHLFRKTFEAKKFWHFFLVFFFSSLIRWNKWITVIYSRRCECCVFWWNKLRKEKHYHRLLSAQNLLQSFSQSSLSNHSYRDSDKRKVKLCVCVCVSAKCSLRVFVCSETFSSRVWKYQTRKVWHRLVSYKWIKWSAKSARRNSKNEEN